MINGNLLFYQRYFCVCGKVINSVLDVREYVRQVQKSLGIQVSP